MKKSKHPWASETLVLYLWLGSLERDTIRCTFQQNDIRTREKMLKRYGEKTEGTKNMRLRGRGIYLATLEIGRIWKCAAANPKKESQKPEIKDIVWRPDWERGQLFKYPRKRGNSGDRISLLRRRRTEPGRGREWKHVCRVQVTMGKAGAWKERASGETERESKRKIKRHGINPIPWMSLVQPGVCWAVIVSGSELSSRNLLWQPGISWQNALAMLHHCHVNEDMWRHAKPVDTLRWTD